MNLTARQKYEALKLTREEFQALNARTWEPVKLEKASIPACLQGLPNDKVVAVFGSGSLVTPNPLADGNADRGQVGGIDVYRAAEETDGVSLNKDWYAIHFDPDDPNILYVVGPKQDAEHWIDTIPSRLLFAEVAGVDGSIDDQSA